MIKRLYLLAAMCLMGTLLLPVELDAMTFVFSMGMHDMQAQFDNTANETNQKAVKHSFSYDCYDIETTFQPCWIPDDDEFFAANGYSRVKFNDVDKRDIIIELCNSLRLQIKMRIGGMYRSIMNDYFSQLGIDGRSVVALHIESAGEQSVDRYLNDTREACRQMSETDELGYRIIYMGIAVSKIGIADAIVKGIEEGEYVPESVKKELRQNEEKFRNITLQSFIKMRR